MAKPRDHLLFSRLCLLRFKGNFFFFFKSRPNWGQQNLEKSPFQLEGYYDTIKLQLPFPLLYFTIKLHCSIRGLTHGFLRCTPTPACHLCECSNKRFVIFITWHKWFSDLFRAGVRLPASLYQPGKFETNLLDWMIKCKVSFWFWFATRLNNALHIFAISLYYQVAWRPTLIKKKKKRFLKAEDIIN